MRHSAQAICISTPILSLLISLMSGCHNSKPDPGRALAEKVATVGCFSSDIEKELADVGQRLDSLSKDESENADRALVMLLGSYLGEHNDEQRDIEIVRRGKRMMPLLEQEKERPITISTCAGKIESSSVRERAKFLIAAIDRGEHRE